MADQRIINLSNWIEKGYAPPEEIQIYSTNKCNLKCIFCCQALNQYNLNDEVSEERWLEIADELCKLGVKKALISGGGEPLMSSTTFAMMRFFKSEGVKGRLITNGTLWTESLITETIRIGWDTIMFSIDGPDAQTHDRLRGVEGCFEKAVKSINRFNELKKSENKDKPRIEINYVLNRMNYKGILSMVKLASSLKVDSLNFEPICMNNPEAFKLRLTEEERQYFMENIAPMAKELASNLHVATNLERVSEVRVIEKAGELDESVFKDLKPKKAESLGFADAICFEPWLWPKIEANGEVWPCSTVPLRENIKEKSFKEIWFGKIFNSFRRKILNHELDESCKNCVLTHLPVTNKIRGALKKYTL